MKKKKPSGRVRAIQTVTKYYIQSKEKELGSSWENTEGKNNKEKTRTSSISEGKRE